jgi:hypothetical protein
VGGIENLRRLRAWGGGGIKNKRHIYHGAWWWEEPKENYYVAYVRKVGGTASGEDYFYGSGVKD